MKAAHSGQMRVRELERVEKSLENFLAGLTAPMGARGGGTGRVCTCGGLLLDGERKSIKRIAMRLGTTPGEERALVR